MFPLGDNAQGIEADLGTSHGASQLIEQIPETDILINNLGIYEQKPFADITDTQWLRYFEVNLLGGIRLAPQHAAKEPGKDHLHLQVKLVPKHTRT